MHIIRRYKSVIISAAAFVFLLTVGLLARANLIGSAQEYMRSTGTPWFQILGTRVPCGGIADVGVIVMYRQGGREVPGRLCRPLFGSGEWEWYPYIPH